MERVRLSNFIKTLSPDNKLDDAWTERYILDIDTLGGYEQAKTMAIDRKRYINIHDMVEKGYDIDDFKNFCDSPTNQSKCNSCCSYDVDKEKCVYNQEQCVLFFVENVKNWSDLCGYHILFLQGKVPGTVDHPGPWNKETKYIIEPLIQILKHNILTIDSQPGLMVIDNDEHKEYLQKPYIIIGGPAGRIQRILYKLFNNHNDKDVQIKYVPYDIRTVNVGGYENFDDNDTTDYVEIVLGIESNYFLTKKYIDYVLSNRFFDKIVEVVSNNL